MVNTTLTIVARIIGCLCLVGSMMISTQIGVELMHIGDSSVKNVTTFSLKAVDVWTINHLHKFPQKEPQLVAIGAYVLTYALFSSLLIYATYVGKRLFTIPWLLSEATCIMCETSTFVSYFSRRKDSFNQLHVIGSVFCLCVAIAMWCVVYEAQRSWAQHYVSARMPSSPPAYVGGSLEQPMARCTPRRLPSKVTVV